MSTILSDKVMTASRRARACDQCGRQIKIGDRYRRQVHTFDGFCVYEAHEDCDAAAIELHKIAGLYPEEAYRLADYGDEDREFLTEKFPGVAERLWPQEART
ncbi:hypothetical protein [Bradyrhizobium sp. SZCCHNS3053]|uniref:hypothetical protein n=1 Tax=Bradyrhizobium sp. SZCCHNS3053 TaxID=3057322 RepID=UPI0029163B52|nr:hypothetical protein [Bradyrhizobium sp. SZCCHNS3053]